MNRNSDRTGFSLVEVVLALLVFAIGILSVLALFPSGLLLSQRAHQDTYISEFAEMALNAVGTELELNQLFWETNDAGFASLQNNYVITPTRPAGLPWYNPPAIIISSNTTYRLMLASNTNVVDRALRYELKLRRDNESEYMPMVELAAKPFVDTVINVVTTRGYVLWVKDNVYMIETNNVVPMHEHMITAHLRVKPGLYGSDGERYFFRYYFDYENRKKK